MNNGNQNKEVLLKVINLKVHFKIKDNNTWFWQQPSKILKAVDGISLSVYKGENLGIIGESGCGKSTFARAIVGLVKVTYGRIEWLGKNLIEMNTKQRHKVRSDIQMIFQDPFSSLNPRMTIGDIIAEPLKTYYPKILRKEVKDRVKSIMIKVGLLPNLINRYPHQCSGGQCQRIGIARSLLFSPKLIICDEIISALDVSIRAQVINLLQQLQREEIDFSLIFIAHDLAVVRHISDWVMVMYLGHAIEFGTYEEVYKNPQHPYTKNLMSAMLTPDPDIEQKKKINILQEIVPSSINPPLGCIFYTRCPIASLECISTYPLMKGDANHLVACFKIGLH
ncbi:murein tripeptide/oligopeptide ABC transporter ATP binding protein OppF [Candidatus Profftia sp. (ex Adelges kitamiensis)]|uniref:murein tripeptide/oligopeptide ABC transporter ATP binding protein OppF n=1 Tax=Candidatus Profftia sp. (ex Adelges kitamiensis) TaxID=2864218 RepID=UPI001CE351A8|nr:murein tripeptide/oligopeptide ABC transporter ATP binding protein OppF [Candidatus Profftia sp. (ex Adelges kitamiensis)]